MFSLKAKDIINGQEGKATTKINGNIEEMFYLKNLEAKMEKGKNELKTIGRRGTQHKAAGWTGTGSFNMYYITSIFRKMALQYAKTGKDVYFDITVVNDDPSSSVGKQTTVLYNCNLDSVTLAKLDIDADSLDEDMDFTFDDFDILDQFNRPILD